ncbi:MAG: hypothetical protein U0990_09650 [Candidatus Nanopelagicales bacterium]|nr:hypothetical protein [Candidatus Nanopelagicales bacterium]
MAEQPCLCVTARRQAENPNESEKGLSKTEAEIAVDRQVAQAILAPQDMQAALAETVRCRFPDYRRRGSPTWKRAWWAAFGKLVDLAAKEAADG